MENFPPRQKFQVSRNSAFVEKGAVRSSKFRFLIARVHIFKYMKGQTYRMLKVIDRLIESTILIMEVLDMERRNPKLEEKTIKIREVGKISIVA